MDRHFSTSQRRNGPNLISVANSSIRKVAIGYPVILSKDLHVSVANFAPYHPLGHAGRNHMLSKLREKYWIIHANSAARKIISDCVVCKRNRGKLVKQKMADLPEERVLPDKVPFTDDY